MEQKLEHLPVLESSEVDTTAEVSICCCLPLQASEPGSVALQLHAGNPNAHARVSSPTGPAGGGNLVVASTAEPPRSGDRILPPKGAK